MFTKDECSYAMYKQILKDILDTERYCDYADVVNGSRKDFLVLRHDIEFSVERAFQLAQVENEMHVKSSYLVQITNNAYNAFSMKNVKMIREMYKEGHHIGLHFHRGNITEIKKVEHEVIRQADILSSMLDIPIDRFSFHRPLREHLEANIKVDGLINMYGSDFFVLLDNPVDIADISVKYIADSNHQWKYGVPNAETFKKYRKLQLLVHPLSWSEKGAEHLENFQMLTQEKHDIFVDTVASEWKIFDLLRGKI